jgi:uncharacterized integral membrane protein
MSKQIVPAIVILIIFAAIGWYADNVAHDDIVWTIRAGLYAVIAALVLALVTGLILAALLFRERYLTQQAERKKAQREADTYAIVSDTHGVFVREMNPKATWRPLHLNPATYQNGQQGEVTEIELTTWQAWQALRAPKVSMPAQASPALLPATTEAESLDLLTVFTQPTQSYAIIGGQQTGKTFQAQHIAAYWLRQGIRPAVIGPKWDKGEWSGCYLLGGNGDFQKVEWAIGMIRQLVESRHADTSRTHKQHSIQPVIFDDWTPIVDSVPNARALVLEATTLYASVNIILYFILHSDTAYAWGVDRKGAALKDNFIKLFIVPTYDPNGQVVRSQTRGYIRFAGETVDRPVKLFATPPIPMGEAREVKPKLLAGPDETESKVLALYAARTSYNEIARQVWGSTGGYQTDRIKRILGKYGAV